MTGGPEDVAARYLARLTEDAVKALARRIEEHRAAGLSDEQGFEERRAARRSAEFAAYKRRVSDRKLRNIIVNGLVLRRLEESSQNQARIDEVRQWLHDIYEPTGLRQAEFVQRGLLSLAIQVLEQSGVPEPRLREQVEALLRGVERFTRFVREDDKEKALGDEIRVRAMQVTPSTFVVFGKGRAKIVAKEGVRLAMKALPPTYVQRPQEAKHDYVAMIGAAEAGQLRVVWML